jgi:hypothetical protein
VSWLTYTTLNDRATECGLAASTVTLTPPGGGTTGTMCKVDADFNGAVNLGDLGLVAPDSTCSSYIADAGWLGWTDSTTGLGLSGAPGAATSWSDVTCDALLSATYTRDSQIHHIAADIGRVGAACCGSIAKTRCFGTATMCKVDADFIGTASDPVQIAPTCAAAAPSALVNWAGKFSWNDVNDATCESMASTSWYSRTGLGWLQVLGATCCGSLAKTRCFDASNTATTTPAPSPPASTVIADTDTKYFVTMTVTMPYRSVCADGLPRSLSPDPKCYLRSP